MNRRHCLAMLGITGLVSAGCAATAPKPESAAPSSRPAGSSRSGGRSRRPRGPQTVKELNTILQRANCPLAEAQINYLLKYESGPQFSAQLNEILDDYQLRATGTAVAGAGGDGRVPGTVLFATARMWLFPLEHSRLVSRGSLAH